MINRQLLTLHMAHKVSKTRIYLVLTLSFPLDHQIGPFILFSVSRFSQKKNKKATSSLMWSEMIGECHCCCSVAQLCLTPCHLMDYSTPGFPVLRYLPEFAHTHIHGVDDAIEASHPLLPLLLLPCLSQHQGLLFQLRLSPCCIWAQ